MQLWDNVKHEALQGINKVENVQGEFASTQDKVQTQDELYSYDFVHGYYDHMRYACGPNGLDIDLPQSMFDELSLIHISEPTRQAEISYAVFCLKKKKKKI